MEYFYVKSTGKEKIVDSIAFKLQYHFIKKGHIIKGNWRIKISFNVI